MLHSRYKNDEDLMADKVSFGIGNGRSRVPERWPFSKLTRGHYFQCDDLTQHTALRTAATRARKKLGKKFSVRKVTIVSGGVKKQAIRVYLQT
jgi:hypothetical protein